MKPNFIKYSLFFKPLFLLLLVTGILTLIICIMIIKESKEFKDAHMEVIKYIFNKIEKEEQIK